MVFPLIAALIMAAGKVKEGQAKKKAGEHDAQVAGRDAAVARDQANAEVLRQQKVARRTIGAARAAYGAAGVTIEGSPLDVLEESAVNAELDSQTIRYRGELRALGATDAAALSRFEGRQAERAGYVNAAGQIFGSMGGASAPNTGSGFFGVGASPY